MKNKMKDKHFLRAVRAYLLKNNLVFDNDMRSFPNIDSTLVCVGDEPVLIVTTDPNVGYVIEETENARLFLRTKTPIAV